MTFKNKLYTELLFFDPVSGSTTAYEYSTIKPIRDQAENVLSSPTITSFGKDIDRDGYFE